VIKQIEYRKSQTLEGPEIYRPLADADVGKWHKTYLREYPSNVRFRGDCVAKLPLMRIANHDSVGRDGIGGSGA